jgi:outer membrane protein assembly factor BamB
MRLTVVEANAAKAASLRKLLTASGYYGERVTVHHHANPLTFSAPPHFANWVVVRDKTARNLTEKSLINIFQSVRPYGGVLLVENAPTALIKTKLAGAEIQWGGNNDVRIIRKGALPGAADWSHQYGDAGQSVVSKDQRVKAPLGLLWFGGPPNDKILPRHGHGPSPQVAGGRLFIEGADMIRAVDVYTGRLLWERELKGVGEYYNITGHFPGAGEIGSNYVSLPDAVYVVYGKTILELDAATGMTRREFKPPAGAANFGWLSVWENYLVTAAAPVAILPPKGQKELPGTKVEQLLARYASGSRILAVFDRTTGKQLWTRTAQFNFRHNNIALGGGKVFAIDSLTDAKIKALARRGIALPGKPALFALDIKTGAIAWQTDQKIFGTFLNYSTTHDLLLQAGSAYRDRAGDEVGKGMTALRGRDGKVLWENRDDSYNGPCLLMKDKIITNGNGGFAIDIKTGQPTGWKYKRNYGCNTAIGSEHLLTFRSGAAGFYDLTNDGGTGNWGGFRSSCTANLIPANGILNAPDYTRTCACAYQMQTSLALIHMPGLEYWTFGATAKPGQLAINLGAPGDRRAPDGKLWVEHPNVGGNSAAAPVTIEPANATPFRLHSSTVKGDGLKWVAASGLRGVKTVKLKLEKKGTYRVRLHFLEPDKLPARARVFDILINGQTVQQKIDITATAGAPRRAVVREFKVVTSNGTIQIDLRPATDLPPILSGIEWSPIP